MGFLLSELDLQARSSDSVLDLDSEPGVVAV